MNLDLNPAQLNTEQLLELVRRLIAENEKLRTENAQLRAEIEELKRKNARPAAPFSKNKRKKNPKRPGRRPGQGKFRNRTAPSAEEYSGPVEDVPVKETACPECGGDLIGEDEEIGANTEIPEAPAPEVKAYRVHIQRSIDEALEGKRGQACGFGLILKSQLKEAVELYQAFHDPTRKLPDYKQRVRALEEEISYHLRPRELKGPDNQRLLNELGRHHERGNLLRFLHEPTTIEPTNNAAERALRPAVIARKVSHCSKNEKGAAALSAFKSVIQTIKKQGGNVLEALADLIRSGPPPEPGFQALN